MNTNPTARALAVLLNSLNRLHGREVIPDLSNAQYEERQDAYTSGLGAVYALAAKNGNSIADIDALADTLADQEAN